MRRGKIAPVACCDEDAPVGKFNQIDIVQARLFEERQLLPRKIIHMQAGLLVGGDNQALFRLGGIAPDRRVIGCILVCRTHRHSFRLGKDRNGRVALDGNGSAGSGDAKRCECEDLEVRAHQNVNLAPAFMVQLYSSYW